MTWGHDLKSVESFKLCAHKASWMPAILDNKELVSSIKVRTLAPDEEAVACSCQALAEQRADAFNTCDGWPGFARPDHRIGRFRLGADSARTGFEDPQAGPKEEFFSKVR
jgi:hypothetical protein